MGFFNITKGGSGMELNKIYNEDCLEGMKRIPDGSVDMILCDLPYGTTACKWDTIIPFEPLWEQYKRVIKDNGAIVLTASQPFTSALVMSNPNMFKHEWIWQKTSASNFMSMKYQPAKKHESILVFAKKSPAYNPIKDVVEKKTNSNKGKLSRSAVYGTNFNNDITYEDTGLRYPSSVRLFSNQSGELNNTNRLHPTQKPVPLFEYLIKTYTNEGETVLDNCMGSGTTAIACMNNNRNYIGFELDKGYFDIANDRIDKHKRDMAKDN